MKLMVAVGEGVGGGRMSGVWEDIVGSRDVSFAPTGYSTTRGWQLAKADIFLQVQKEWVPACLDRLESFATCQLIWSFCQLTEAVSRTNPVLANLVETFFTFRLPGGERRHGELACIRHTPPIVEYTSRSGQSAYLKNAGGMCSPWERVGIERRLLNLLTPPPPKRVKSAQKIYRPADLVQRKERAIDEERANQTGSQQNPHRRRDGQDL